MPLVGRKAEQQTLESFYQSNRPEFLALIGRRRIGKTFLINEFFSTKKCTFMRVTGIKDGKLREQIAHFTQSISHAFLGGTELKEQNDWFDTLRLLTNTIHTHAPKNRNIVLFLDEFPWMATHRSKLLQAIDHFWNHHWSNDPRIKLIICGSSASWIINKILNNKGGLHNRVTRQMQLKPFTLNETKQFLASNGVKLNHWQTSQIYMLTGGVPFYLSFIEKGQSSAQAIEHLAFSGNAPLLKEFDNLFSSLFGDEAPYIELLRLIAKNRYGISRTDLIEQSEQFSKGGRISEKLKDLKNAGFILAFKPHDHKAKGVYYRVVDEYTLFYLHWIEPIRDTLQEGSLEKGYWQALQNTPAWHSWAGYSFEAMVYKHLSQVRKALNIPVTATSNTWRYVPKKGNNDRGAQIDLLFDRQDDCVTLCEIKYTHKAFTIDKSYAAQLAQKCDVFKHRTKTKKQLFIAMISASGLKDNPYSDALIAGLVTLKDLFSG